MNHAIVFLWSLAFLSVNEDKSSIYYLWIILLFIYKYLQNRREIESGRIFG